MSLLAAVDPPLPDVVPGFGDQPFWILLIKANGTFVILLLMVVFTITFERKWVSWMQHRIGPNRTGPWGLLQAVADGVKLMFKEDLIPSKVDKIVFLAAPVLSTAPAIIAFATIPMGPEVSMFGHHTPLQITDLPVGVLVIFACSSLGVYGIVLSGWSSGSSYPLLGALRSSAQMISYEVAMGLSMVAVFLYSESMSTSQIVSAQNKTWNIFPLFVSFAIYAISIVGETNRAPFDLAEAESELVGGFHTEYSSMKFAMFFLAEYINMVTVSALCVTLFLGGWHAPFGLVSIWAGANSGWFPMIWFFVKVIMILFVFVWLRGTLPRLRYDQFMKLGWKVMIPINLVWILAVATQKVLTDPRGMNWPRLRAFAVVVLPLLAVIIAVTVAMEAATSRRRANAILDDQAEAELGPAFPTPPMDLVVPPSPMLASVGARAASKPAALDKGEATDG